MGEFEWESWLMWRERTIKVVYTDKNSDRM